MATFRKRKNRWDVQIRRSGYPLICKTFSHKTDAQKWAVETERQIGIGEYAPADLANLDTLGALLAQYGAAISIKKRGHEAETLRLTKMVARPAPWPWTGKAVLLIYPCVGRPSLSRT